jgi:chemotaxis signal transduction protein
MHLLFFRDGGVRFAVDRAQVLTVESPEPGRAGHQRHFLETLGEKPAPTPNGRPMLLGLRTEPETQILVDEMETISEVKQTDLRPLPSLVEARSRPLGVWAVALLQGDLVLLVDFQHLPSLLATSS